MDMRNKKLITEEADVIMTLKMISQAYQEVSVMRMQKIRKLVIQTRNFLAKFSEVFYDVKTSYQKEIEAIAEKKTKKPFMRLVSSTIKTGTKNGKTVSVLLSANSKLYGEIANKVCHLFVEEVKDKPGDIMIIGKYGGDYFKERGSSSRNFLYFEIPDTDVTMEDLKPIAYNLIPYEKINVYYGRFENILKQDATISNVSGDKPFDVTNYTPNQQKPADHRFLFEPSLDNILNFFEMQIFTSLFKQTIHESHLAHFASRVMAMENALGNIDNRIGSLSSEMRSNKRLTQNKKQIELISGMSLWQK